MPHWALDDIAVGSWIRFKADPSGAASFARSSDPRALDHDGCSTAGDHCEVSWYRRSQLRPPSVER
jgi:hypothetical protein